MAFSCATTILSVIVITKPLRMIRDVKKADGVFVGKTSLWFTHYQHL